MAKQPYVSKSPAQQTTEPQTESTEQTAPETQSQAIDTQSETDEGVASEVATEGEQSSDAEEKESDEVASESTQTEPATETVEPPAVTEPTPTPAADPAPALPVVEVAQPLAAIDRLVAEPVEVSVLKQTLQTYAADMAINRRIAPEEGAGQQLMLFNSLQSTVTHPDAQTFIALMGTWLEFIRQHRGGVFREEMIYRFMEHVTLTKAKMQQFQYLLHLFVTIADGVSVKERIDTTTALRGFEDSYASRLATYAQRVTGQ